MESTKYIDYTKQPGKIHKIWKAAFYIRLSKDDGDDKNESYSVTSQREILKEYARQHPDIEEYDYYVDDGWSGTSFDRPDFNRMMNDVYSGNVNCVIVKDLSRFGRNYTEGGNLLDNVFVRLRIRFIALNNCIDTFSESMNAATRCVTVGVQNVINESLAATTSVNVRGTLNLSRKQGKFIGSFSPYGYLKSPDDRHKLIIDEDTASIVQQIFNWFIGGKSIIGIAKELNSLGIPNPSMYKQLKGFNYNHPSGRKNDGLWSDSTVRRILQNQVYIGDMIQGKNTTISYKIRQCRAIPKEEWIIVKDTHEPIIDKATFEKVQSLFNNNIRVSPNKNEVDLFSGLVRCASCLRSMNKKTNIHSYGIYNYYRCVTSRKMKKGQCPNHTIRIDRLEKAVFVTLQKMIDTAIHMDEILKNINADSKRQFKIDNLTAALQIQIKEREKCKNISLDLYPDWKNGIITNEEYLLLKANIQEKIQEFDRKIESIKKSVDSFTDSAEEENDFISNFKKYGNIDKLNRPMIIELIDEILIHQGGRITIQFKFQDAYTEAVEYINRNKDFIQYD